MASLTLESARERLSDKMILADKDTFILRLRECYEALPPDIREQVHISVSDDDEIGFTLFSDSSHRFDAIFDFDNGVWATWLAMDSSANVVSIGSHKDSQADIAQLFKTEVCKWFEC